MPSYSYKLLITGLLFLLSLLLLLPVQCQRPIRVAAVGRTWTQLCLKLQRPRRVVAADGTETTLDPPTGRRSLGDNRGRQHALHDVQPGRAGSSHCARRKYRQNNLGAQI